MSGRPVVIAERYEGREVRPPGCRIRGDGFGLEFLWTRNGWQWVGGGVDVALLKTMRDTINEALEALERTESA